MTKELKLYRMFGTLGHEKEVVFRSGSICPTDSGIAWDLITATLPAGWEVGKNCFDDYLLFRDGSEVGYLPEDVIRTGTNGNPVLWDPETKERIVLDYSEPV